MRVSHSIVRYSALMKVEVNKQHELMHPFDARRLDVRPARSGDKISEAPAWSRVYAEELCTFYSVLPWGCGRYLPPRSCLSYYDDMELTHTLLATLKWYRHR